MSARRWREGELRRTHLVDLVNFASARQQGFSQNELAKDATYRPHVDRRAVLCRAEQELRRAEAVRGSAMLEEVVCEPERTGTTM